MTFLFLNVLPFQEGEKLFGKDNPVGTNDFKNTFTTLGDFTDCDDEYFPKRSTGRCIDIP